MPGTSVLEASRLAGIPHAHVCGGRGRCSTCRVRVRAEAGSIDPPGETERRVLRRIRATSNVRLACQLRPKGKVEVTPLLPPFAYAMDGRRRVDVAQGREREIAIMFTDIRGFTALSEGRLPYDVVFILNRYFAAVGRSVEGAGGRIDKFLGDGVMALFGIDDGAARREPRRARRRPDDIGTDGRAERVIARRTRRAAPDRHRHSYRADHRRRDGLWRDVVDHRDRRCGQYREPAAGADQGIRLRTRRVGGGGASALGSNSPAFRATKSKSAASARCWRSEPCRAPPNCRQWKLAARPASNPLRFEASPQEWGMTPLALVVCCKPAGAIRDLVFLLALAAPYRSRR